MAEADKLLVWMNMPSHHQSAFFEAIRERGIDLKVFYYGDLDNRRRQLGWQSTTALPHGEKLVAPVIASLTQCSDWKDRIHVIPGSVTNLFLCMLVRYLSARNVRWMHWSEQLSRDWRRAAFLPMQRWYASVINRHALGALAIGEAARRDFLRWGVAPEKIHFLPYAVASLQVSDSDERVSSFAARWPLVFAFVGERCHRKGADILLNAFASTIRSGCKAGLVLVGQDSSKGRYDRLVGSLAIRNAVLDVGVVSADTVGRAISAAHVLVLPSRHDGWGLVLNEAASLSKALIASDACGASEHVILSEYNGMRVRAGSVASLAGAMRSYGDDPDLAVTHGNRSRAIFESLSPSANAARLAGILARVS